jgi:transposase-like protein
MYLFSQSKNGVSAKEIERQLGVTYKTAFRMLHKIRSLLTADSALLNGIIELDETFVGGKNKNRHKDKKVKGCQGRSFKDKTPVFGMLQRDGDVKAFVVPNTNTESLIPHAFNHIEKGATVYTDEWYAYGKLSERYTHAEIDHSKGEYADGDITTNRVENFWSNVKRTLSGTHITVSPKYLQNYVNEVAFKFNNRTNKNVFNTLLTKI